jgi:hypothetical protein
MIFWIVAWLANAEPGPGDAPVCVSSDVDKLPTPPDRLAVVWIQRWKKPPRGALRVVAAADFAGWVAAQHPAWTGRTLQRLGERRRSTDPKRRWKVVVFEVARDALCRPVDGVDGQVAGIDACPAAWSAAGPEQDGCGSTWDRKTGEPGFVAYYIKARAAGASGMCQIPLVRYLDEAGKRPSAIPRK